MSAKPAFAGPAAFALLGTLAVASPALFGGRGSDWAAFFTVDLRRVGGVFWPVGPFADDLVALFAGRGSDWTDFFAVTFGDVGGVFLTAVATLGSPFADDLVAAVVGPFPEAFFALPASFPVRFVEVAGCDLVALIGTDGSDLAGPPLALRPPRLTVDPPRDDPGRLSFFLGDLSSAISLTARSGANTPHFSRNKKERNCVVVVVVGGGTGRAGKGEREK